MGSSTTETTAILQTKEEGSMFPESSMSAEILDWEEEEEEEDLFWSNEVRDEWVWKEEENGMALVSPSKEVAATSREEMMDGNEVIFLALNQVKTASEVATSSVTKLDEAQKGTCLHKWPLLPSAGPSCSEDVIRVMKSLKPVLNTSLHVKKAAAVTGGTKGGQLKVEGPLTWRQFHHMAGVVTKVRVTPIYLSLRFTSSGKFHIS